MDMSLIEKLRGLKVLVVEDDYIVATDLMLDLEDRGVQVIGPAASVSDALSLIEIHGEQLACACVDINLKGHRAFPVADALAAREIPFIFSTGYDAWVVPRKYEAVPRCEKPLDTLRVMRELAARLPV